MALSAIQKQCPQNRASLGGLLSPMLANRGVIFPAREELFPHTLQPQETPSPRNPIPTYSVSWLGAISREAAPRMRSSCLGHPQPSGYLAISWASPRPCRCCTMLRRANSGHACRWHTCRWDRLVPTVALGLPSITQGIRTGMR